MKSVAVLAMALCVGACTQVASDHPPLTLSGEQRCAEFSRIAGDMTATAYRRATAMEQLRALRCSGYQ